MSIRCSLFPFRSFQFALTVTIACGWMAVLAQPPAPFQPTASFKGHTDPIYAVVVSPDGKQAATGSFDKTVKLWDLTTGKEVRVLAGKNGHQNQVLSVAYAPDGSAIASGGSDNAVKVWELPSLKPTTTLEQAAAVTRVAVSPDGKMLATAAASGNIKLWSIGDGKAGESLTGHMGPVTGLGFAPNNQTLVSVGADRMLRYWNPTNGQLIATIGASTADLTGLTVNPANGSIATMSADGQLRLWPAQVTLQKSLAPQSAGSTALALSPEGNVLVTAIEDKSVRVVNTTTGQQIQLFTGLPATPKSVAVAANGQLVIAGTPDGKVHVWGADGKPRGSFTAHEGEVTDVALLNQTPITAGADGRVRTWGAIPAAPKPLALPDALTVLMPLADGKRFAIGSADKNVRIATASAVEKTYSGHNAAITAIAESGANLISGDASGGLLAWTTASGQKTAIAPAGPKSTIASIVPQPGSTGFAVVYSDGTIQYRPVLVAKEKEKPQEPKSFAHPAPILAAVFTPDGKKLLTICSDRSLRTWSIDSGKSDPPVSLSQSAIKAGTFSADRTKVAVAMDTSGSTKLVVTTTATGAKPLLEVSIPGSAEALAFSPNATRIAVASVVKGKRMVRVLDSANGRVLQTVAEPTSPAIGLGFLADNKTVALGSGKQFELVEMAVTSVTVSAPGNMASLVVLPNSQLVTAGADKLVRLWDTAGQKEARTFGPLPSAITTIAASRDGQAVAAASGKQLKIWGVGDGKDLATITAPAEIRALAFNADRTKILAGLADGSAIVYDLATGLPAQTARLAGAITGVAFHPTQPVFYLTGADKQIAAVPFVLTKQLVDPAAIGTALAVNPAGSHLLTGGPGKGVTIWNAASGAKERTLEVTGPVSAVAVSKNGQLVAVAHGPNSQVTLLQFNDGSVVGRFPAGNQVAELAFHPTAPVLVGSLPDRVASWSVAFEPGQPLPAEFGKPIQEFPHAVPVRSIAILPDGSAVVTGSEDKQARLWKLPSDQPKSLAHPNLVDAVAWDKTSKLLATGCHDGNLRVWDVAKGAATKTIAAHTQPTANPIYAVAWTPDGKQVATASFDKTIKLWDADSGKLVREFRAGTDKVPIEAKLGKPAPALLGGAGGGWLNAPAEAGHRDQVFTLSFSKDGQFLASGSSDRTIKLWATATGQVVREFPNPTIKAPPASQPHPSHPGFVHMVKLTPDGSKLVSAGTAPRGQGYLAVWSVAEGRLLAAKELPVGPIYSFDLTPNGVLLGCGPKTRFQSESEALLVPLPVK